MEAISLANLHQPGLFACQVFCGSAFRHEVYFFGRNPIALNQFQNLFKIRLFGDDKLESGFGALSKEAVGRGLLPQFFRVVGIS